MATTTQVQTPGRSLVTSPCERGARKKNSGSPTQGALLILLFAARRALGPSVLLVLALQRKFRVGHLKMACCPVRSLVRNVRLSPNAGATGLRTAWWEPPLRMGAAEMLRLSGKLRLTTGTRRSPVGLFKSSFSLQGEIGCPWLPASRSPCQAGRHQATSQGKGKLGLL